MNEIQCCGGAMGWFVAAVRQRVSVSRATLSGRLVALLCLLVIGAALALIASKDPRDHGLGVLCPSRRLFGIYCPGCGSTRATFDLLCGNVGSAWRCNPAMVALGIPVLSWFVVTTMLELLFGIRVRLFLPRAVGIALAAVLIGYGVARNVPLDALDWARPPATR